MTFSLQYKLTILYLTIDMSCVVSEIHYLANMATVCMYGDLLAPGVTRHRYSSQQLFVHIEFYWFSHWILSWNNWIFLTLYVCLCLHACVYFFWIVHLFYKLQDVAVKVLTVQDFHDDQLKEFLREVCIDSIHDINVLSFLITVFVCDLDCIN